MDANQPVGDHSALEGGATGLLMLVDCQLPSPHWEIQNFGGLCPPGLRHLSSIEPFIRPDASGTTASSRYGKQNLLDDPHSARLHQQPEVNPSLGIQSQFPSAPAAQSGG